MLHKNSRVDTHVTVFQTRDYETSNLVTKNPTYTKKMYFYFKQERISGIIFLSLLFCLKLYFHTKLFRPLLMAYFAYATLMF